MPLLSWFRRARKSPRRLSAKHREARRRLFSFSQLEDRRVLAAEADVFGNNSPIADNATTTSATNHTNFGSVTVPGTTNVVRTFTITNSGDADLTVGTVTIGTAGGITVGSGDFSVISQPAALLHAGESTTFEIKFDPTTAVPGLNVRQAKVSFATNDSNENPYDFRISGTGIDPQDIYVTNNDSNPLTWIEIGDGDTTPALADGTDYGGIPVGATLVHNFRVGNASLTTSLGFVSPKVSVTGTDFTIDAAALAALPASIGALGAVSIPITFHPTTPGVKTATVSIFTNDPDSESTYTFDVTGVSGAPEINITGNGVDINDGDTEASTTDDTHFGSLELVGQSAIHTFTIQNNGDDDLSLTNITFANATTLGGLVTLPGKDDFSVAETFGSTLLAPGATTTFKIKFDPNDTNGGGDRYAVVQIGSNDSNENPYNFYLQGKGLAPPDISVAEDISDIAILAAAIPDGDTTPTTDDGTDFGGTRLLGGTVVHSFRILNSGDVPLTINSITITGDDDPNPNFTITLPTPTTVPAASSLLAPGEATFEITFDPTVEGLHSATVNISSNDPTESEALYTFDIQGIGGFPDLRVTTGEDEIADNDETSLPGDPTDFGAADLSGQTFTKTFTLTNNGDRTLELGDITIDPATILGIPLPGSGDFTIVTPPSDNSLAPGESTTLVVKYDPSPLAKGGINTSPLNPDVNSPDYKSGLTATDVFRAAIINIASNDTGKNPFNFAVSGQALVGTVRVTKSGSTLTIDDIAPGGHPNGFVVSILGSDLIVSDALSVETITYDSEARTGGVLSAFNKVLTIPAAGIRTVTINGNGGDDTFQLGLTTGLTTVNMNGGDGDDSFGSSLLGIIPQPLTTIKINGGANTAAGDKVYTDISLLPSLPAITLGTQANNGTTTLFAVPFIGYTYTGVEVASLRDNNTATEFVNGDFYARGGTGADKFDIKDYKVKNKAVANQATFTYSGIPTSVSPYLIPGKVIFTGRAGNDSFTTSYTGHSVYMYGEEGNDSLKGGSAADKIVGGPGNDSIDGGEGNNLIWGDNDPIVVGLADTPENREALSDNVPGEIPAGLSAAPHPTNLTYNDAIKAGNGNDEIYAGPGNDGTSSTRVNAGGGDDVVFGGDGNDFIELGAGNDRGYGGAGNDNMNGGNGNDLLAGNDGVDTLRGGAGNDVLIGGAGVDSINGDTNTDRVYQGNVTVTVNTNKLPLLPPVAAVPYVGTDKSRRKGDIHDQAMAELIADWMLDGALGANLTVVTDDVVTTG